MLTTQRQVRAAFWEVHSVMAAQARFTGTLTRRQNYQPADTRCAFVEFVDSLARSGEISEALASRVTL